MDELKIGLLAVAIVGVVMVMTVKNGNDADREWRMLSEEDQKYYGDPPRTAVEKAVDRALGRDFDLSKDR